MCTIFIYCSAIVVLMKALLLFVCFLLLLYSSTNTGYMIQWVVPKVVRKQYFDVPQ